MLVFDKTSALLIALAFGTAGIPLAWWLFRKDKEAKWIEKLVMGYTFGIVLVPFLFLLEFIAVKMKYDPVFIYINWLALFALGIALCIKDKVFSMPKFEMKMPNRNDAMLGGLLLIMLAVFFIGYSVAGIPIMDLDPYYYLDGVRQVAYEGYNYINDGTAWYPLPISSHTGNPVWKYMMASWFSLYNQNAAYDPFKLIVSASVYPPIIGALTAFFAYFLFSRLYSGRTGLIAAGLFAFAPTMMLKFQGGDFQLEPYNVFAMVMLFAAIVYALKKPKDENALALLAIASIAAFLGSNLGSLMFVVINAVIFCMGIAYFLQPTSDARERQAVIAKFVAISFACNFIMALYNVRTGEGMVESLKGSLPYLLAPVMAFAGPWILGRITEEIGKAAKLGKDIMPMARIAVLLAAAIAGVFVFMLLQNVEPVKSIAQAYILFGAYTEPLYRTIAEQAPGSASYSGQIGFIAINFGSIDNSKGDLAITMYSLGSAIAGALNFVPTALVNGAYKVFVLFMNSVSGFDTFQYIEKSNGMLTLFVFWGTLALAASLGYSIYKGRAWAIDALLFLPFIIPVALFGFGKQKLVLYLCIAIIFLAASLWGNAERGIRLLVSEYFAGHRKKGSQKHQHKDEDELKAWLARIAAAGAIALVIVQFGGAFLFGLQLPGSATTTPLFDAINPEFGFSGAPLLFNAFDPRVYDNQQQGLIKLKRYCLLEPQNPVCASVDSWNQTINNPDAYFNEEICARSLWPELSSKKPTVDMSIAISYRCSFVATYWLDSMEWINKNVGENDRVISWWDYGHWINFFGQRKTVLRNEQTSRPMIGQTAHAFLHGDGKELRDTMRQFGSRYALIDIEILGSGSDKNNLALGGKYGALNYLGCAWANQTSVEKWPGQSQCEQDHIWEYAVVPGDAASQKQCTISQAQGTSGVTGFAISTDANGQTVGTPTYCFAQEMINGQRVVRGYKYGQTDADGNPVLQRAVWKGYAEGQNIVLTAYYTKDKIWQSPDGNLTDGWEDRTTKFYDSNVYSAFFLNRLEGFDLVYNSPQVRIFKMSDEYWNSSK